ncbi:hypothetical protein HB852_15160 [Listeria grandensis]|uniref:hypothetical protein n=1 Tax=Listeria grandensis TaxID=1494963 RepID=UPI001624C337|nr:hypothetical protein [Listeria grandensis]MBC1475954.1 hypothetical protein [Listeria grandensis]
MNPLKIPIRRFLLIGLFPAACALFYKFHAEDVDVKMNLFLYERKPLASTKPASGLVLFFRS